LLRRLHVEGFKSIGCVDVELPGLTVLFGPNAAGKSNFLDAIQAVSRLGTERTVSDAMSDPIRGHAVEAFSFGPEGLPALLSSEEACFTLEADLRTGKDDLRYRVQVCIQPRSGGLSVRDEYLAVLNRRGEPRGTASVERVGDQLRIRRKSKPAHPRHEPVGLNHTILSDPRLGGVEYRYIERYRQELEGWRTYYLDPRSAMRQAKPPAEVSDIGLLGENIAPFLYRLRAQSPKQYAAAKRTMRSLVPGVEDVEVDLDKRRGTLDILIRQNGTDFSSRIVSEGTLRVLALCAIAANPWAGGLVAFEEPENGVHPRRLELIAELLTSLALRQGRQVIVTSHSPVFCGAVLKRAKSDARIALLNVRGNGRGNTEIRPFGPLGPLYDDEQIRGALADPSEEAVFQALLMRGLIDG